MYCVITCIFSFPWIDMDVDTCTYVEYVFIDDHIEKKLICISHHRAFIEEPVEKD